MNQTEALQAALAGEHAALYGVGVAGGKLSGARFRDATDAFEVHRNNRDHLSALLVALVSTYVLAGRTFAIETRLAYATSQLTWGGAPMAFPGATP